MHSLSLLSGVLLLSGCTTLSSGNVNTSEPTGHKSYNTHQTQYKENKPVKQENYKNVIRYINYLPEYL